jgi:hypothetical protein
MIHLSTKISFDEVSVNQMSFDQKAQKYSNGGYLRMRSRSRSISFRQHPKHGHPKQNVIKLFYGFKLQFFNKAIVFDPDIPVIDAIPFLA